MKKYDVIIIGAGPGGIFSAYELLKNNENLKIAIFEEGHALEKRKCPIDGKKIKSCIHCKSCSIMSGFGGAGAFSDGKYNITNDFGGTLYEYIGKEKALELMQYVDEINMQYGGEGTRLYSTAGKKFKKLCLQNRLQLLNASVRHLGTDVNYIVLQNMYAWLKDRADFYFDTPVQHIEKREDGYQVIWYIVFMFSFLNKEICHNFKIAAEATDLFLCKPCDFKYFHFIIIDILIQSFRNFHQSFDILFPTPMMICAKI